MFPPYPYALFTGSTPKANAHKHQRTAEEGIEEESEFLPYSKLARQIDLERKKRAIGAMGQGKKSLSRKPTPVKPFTKMSVKEYTMLPTLSSTPMIKSECMLKFT